MQPSFAGSFKTVAIPIGNCVTETCFANIPWSRTDPSEIVLLKALISVTTTTRRASACIVLPWNLNLLSKISSHAPMNVLLSGSFVPTAVHTSYFERFSSYAPWRRSWQHVSRRRNSSSRAYACSNTSCRHSSSPWRPHHSKTPFIWWDWKVYSNTGDTYKRAINACFNAHHRRNRPSWRLNRQRREPAIAQLFLRHSCDTRLNSYNLLTQTDVVRWDACHQCWHQEIDIDKSNPNCQVFAATVLQRIQNVDVLQ